jgi:hypothetical protein
MKVQTSGRKIEIYIAESRNILVGGLSSTLVETIIFLPEDSTLPRWEKCTTFDRRMQLFLGQFPLSSHRFEIYITEPWSFLLKRISSMLVETIIFQPEDSMLPCLEEILPFPV